MNPTKNLTAITQHVSAHHRRRAMVLAVAATFAFTACGGSGSTDTDVPDVDVPDVEVPDVEVPDVEVPDVGDLDLDPGQQDVLDDLQEDLDDLSGDDDTASETADAPWSGVRLVDGRGSARLETLDPEAFSGVTEVFSTSIPDPLGNLEFNTRTLDDSVVVGETLWVSAQTALHRVELADGTISASLPIDDVLPDGEFGDITGDADGVYVVAITTDVDGTDVIVEVDPTAATVRSTIDITDPAVPLLTIASNGTHVAAAFRDAPGIPVTLVERATGTVTDVGDYLDLHEVHFVRDELWVVSASGSVSEPGTYERFDLDGTKLGDGTLPRPGTLRIFGDRAVLVELSNAVDPAAPVAPTEVEPVGAPIESFLPDGMVSITAYAEIDGFAISSGSCCLQDEGGFPLRTAVVDMATGEVVDTADSVSATAILPAV